MQGTARPESTTGALAPTTVDGALVPILHTVRARALQQGLGGRGRARAACGYDALEGVCGPVEVEESAVGVIRVRNGRWGGKDEAEERARWGCADDLRHAGHEWTRADESTRAYDAC